MSDFILKTGNYNTIQAVCSEALSNSKFIGIVGYPGAGKTTSLRSFCKNKTNVFYVRATASMPAREFYRQILFEMGVEGENIGLSLHDLIRDISYRLNYNETRKLLVVDEAGKFKPKFLEYIHELRDNTEHTTGIIFAGPQYFKDRIVGWKNRGVVGIPELFRRINHWEVLEPPTKNEIRAFCHYFGINDESFISELYRNCDNFGEIVNRISEYMKINEIEPPIEVLTNV